jgi:hypothetical protein
MPDTSPEKKPPSSYGESTPTLSPRAVVGIVIAALVVVFFVENWNKLTNDLELRFIIPTVTMQTWVWMVILTVAGLLAGFMFGRSRYKKPKAPK